MRTVLFSKPAVRLDTLLLAISAETALPKILNLLLYQTTEVESACRRMTTLHRHFHRWYWVHGCEDFWYCISAGQEIGNGETNYPSQIKLAKCREMYQAQKWTPYRRRNIVPGVLFNRLLTRASDRSLVSGHGIWSGKDRSSGLGSTHKQHLYNTGQPYLEPMPFSILKHHREILLDLGRTNNASARDPEA